MRRSLTTAVAVLTVATLAAVPSQAAVKKKPKPIKGSYTLTLPPDPSKEATSLTDPGCSGLLPISKDSRPFTLPAAGTLQVKLDVADQTGANPAVGVDWDLYLMEDGIEAAAADGATGNEVALLKVKRKTAITIDACNLTGQPTATVSYVFTYR